MKTLQIHVIAAYMHTSADAVYRAYARNNLMYLQTQLPVCIS